MTCKKVRFATEKDAIYYIDKLRRTSERKVLLQDAYLCPDCLTWHLTTRGTEKKVEIDRLKDKVISLENRLRLKQNEVRELQKKCKEYKDKLNIS